MPRVYVTGLGVVSSIGLGVDAYWKALLDGVSGISEVSLFDTSLLGRNLAGEIKIFDPKDHLTQAEQQRVGRCSAFAVAAARMAVEHSGLKGEQIQGERTSVVIGTTMGEANVLGELQRSWIHQGEAAVKTDQLPRYGSSLLPLHVARAFGAKGIAQTLPAACAAGNYAIGFGADLIRSGRAEVVIAGATEVLEKLEYAGFVRLGAVAPDKVQPFDKNRKGLILGEGAGILILESESHAIRRNATVLAEVGGYGLACDAHHITRPHPDGVGSLQAMSEAIESSGLFPSDIDHINAHGTATPSNDPAEAVVIKKIFCEKRVPITSIKSMIGHCMGAASALEAVACIKTITDGVVPPTVNHEELDEHCDVEVVTTPTNMKVKTVLNNALAFGGYDAVVCFAQADHLPVLH